MESGVRVPRGKSGSITWEGGLERVVYVTWRWVRVPRERGVRVPLERELEYPGRKE